MSSSTRWRVAAGFAAAFASLTLLMTYPLSRAPASRLLDLGPDTRLFLWTLGWDVHAMTTAPWGVFDANIFYPAPWTLAYSEHQIGSALLAAPLLLLGGNLVLAMNAVVLFSCVACALGAYVLARQLGAGVWGSLAAGVIYAFAAPRFLRLGQLHLATVQWIPFCLAFLHAYAARGRLRHLMGAVALFTLQALCGGQSGLFLALTAASLGLYLALVGRWQPRGSTWRGLALAAGLIVALNAPFVWPYLEIQEELGMRRSLAEARAWSPNAASFLAAPTHAQRAFLTTLGLDRAILGAARAYLFPGFLTLALAGLAVTARSPKPAVISCKPPRAARAAGRDLGRSRRRLRGVLDTVLVLTAMAAAAIQAAGGIHGTVGPLRISARSGGRLLVVFAVVLLIRLVVFKRARFHWAGPLAIVRETWLRWTARTMGIEGGFYLLATLVSFWASLGPDAGLYAALYRWVPGLDFVRVPSRLSLITVLGLAILAALGMDALLARVRRFRAVAGAAVVLLLLAELAAFPLDARPYAVTIPDVDRWLAETPGGEPVVELPVADPRDAVRAARLHSRYMLHSTAHWRPLVNGYSGFTPPEHDRLFRHLVNFPDEASLDRLEAWGVGYAVVHADLYVPGEWAEVERRLKAFEDRLRLEHASRTGRVYALTRSSPTRADRRW